MSSRSQRAKTATESVEILERGWYTSSNGQRVSIDDSLTRARENSVLYAPDQFGGLSSSRNQQLNKRPRHATRFEAVNQTTLAAARRLAQAPDVRVLALNFASAKNPGGGFLGGSQAQEESLARASGLYACLAPMSEMYETNRHFGSCLYTDFMIYSPDVPVFRDDDDRLIEQPYLVSFLTAPAVNAGAVAQNEPGRCAQIEPVMRSRIEKVLTLAVVQGHESLVLGAWGCGVFRNSPARVAEWFFDHLAQHGRFAGAFAQVIFAVLDRTDGEEIIEPFVERFLSGNP